MEKQQTKSDGLSDKIIEKIFVIGFRYCIELLLGVIVFFVIKNISLDFFFLLLIVIFSLENRTNFLRALIRVYQVTNERNLSVINSNLSLVIKKMGITEDELRKGYEKYEFREKWKDEITKEQKESLEEDTKTVTYQ